MAIAAIAYAYGIVNPIKPKYNIGGCNNIAQCCKSGFNPDPILIGSSTGVNGFSKATHISKKNDSMIDIYDRKWRDKSENDAPKDIKPVIRFKSKIDGTSILKDLVQGDVEIDNNTIEDFIILRNDGTPTYNLSASVDDHQKVTAKFQTTTT